MQHAEQLIPFTKSDDTNRDRSWVTIVSCAVGFGLVGALVYYQVAKDFPGRPNPFLVACGAFVLIAGSLIFLQAAGLIYYDLKKKTLILSPWFGWWTFGVFVLGFGTFVWRVRTDVKSDDVVTWVSGVVLAWTVIVGTIYLWNWRRCRRQRASPPV